jgi:hypothetical protein
MRSESQSDRSPPTFLALGVWVAIGVAVGLADAYLAALMAGAGHGWTSAFPCSLLVILGAPVAAVAWILRRKHIGFYLALAMLIVATVTNAYLWRTTVAEGVEYVGKVWSTAPALVILWAVMFASWQLVALAVVLCRGALPTESSQ